MTIMEVEALLSGLTDAERHALLRILRERYGVNVHPLEQRWNTTAEAILEAIDQSSDLTQRGIRGVLAEATFRTVVLPEKLQRWKEQLSVADQSFDLMLTDDVGQVRVQVKLQRKELGAPKLYRGKSDHFVVETQRTRGGKRPDQEASRPYRIGEFDVLAVCLHPSTGDWTSFIYCASRDLLRRANNPQLLEVLQPVPMNDSTAWNRDFEFVVGRFRETT